MRTYLRDLCIRLACMLDPGADVIVRHRDIAMSSEAAQRIRAAQRRVALAHKGVAAETDALAAARELDAAQRALCKARDDAARELETLRAQLGD